jgi:hypothetical protein
MADTEDSKSSVREDVRVQVPPRPPRQAPGRETRPAPKTTAAVTTAAEPPAIAPTTGFEKLEAPFSPDPNVPLMAVLVFCGNDPGAPAPKSAKRPPSVGRASARRAAQGSHSAR